MTGADRTPADDTPQSMTRADSAAERMATEEPHDRRTIIVGYDGSEPAKRALARAGDLAREHTRIVVVAVMEPYPRSGITIAANRDPAEIRRRREELQDAHTVLSRRGIQAETIQVRGNPADILVEASSDADLVIVGSRRLSRLQGLILGSVSAKLVRDAACDVLVVR
jgi:nucleotide-binding universal stress UspA family protein